MSTLLTALRDNSQWQRCLILAESEQLDAVCLNSAMSACERATQWQIALALYRTSPRSSLQSSNTAIQALSIAFAAPLEACAQGALWQEALQLLRSRSPDEVSYAAVMLALLRGSCSALALEVFQEAQEQEVGPRCGA